MVPSPTHKIDYVSEGLARLTSQYQKPRPNTAPVVLSMDPAIGPLGAGTAVTITGTNFTGATAVTIGGTACTSIVVVNATTITCVTPAKSAGIYDLVVTSPNGSGTLTGGYAALSMALWLRADRGITLNGSNVSAWADQSGGGNNVSQGTAGNQPAFNSSNGSFNSKPSVDPVYPRYLNGSISTIAQPFAIFGAGKSGTSTGAEQMFLDTDPAERMLGCSGSGAIQTYFSIQLIGVGQTTTPAAIGAIINGASSSVFFNAKTPVVTGNAGTGQATTLYVGAYSGAPNTAQFHWGGPICEVILLNVLPTTPMKDAILTYLGARYGLTIGS